MPPHLQPGFLGHLLVNIAGLHDRLGLIAPTALGVQATLNSALAITQDLRIASLHSKWPFSLGGFGLVTATNQGFRAFRVFCAVPMIKITLL